MKNKTYKPFHIGQKFRIVPPALDPTDDRMDIIMSRGAFGSGEHETTKSCIEIMELLELSGKRFIDLGSGTGILAIAAQKLGATNGLCIDIEEEAVECARHNCSLNGIGKEIKHYCGTLADVVEEGFDFALANIYGDILLNVCEDLVAKVKPGGMILLSGILWEYNYDVRAKYEKNGCKVIKNRMMEEFSTVLLKISRPTGH